MTSLAMFFLVVATFFAFSTYDAHRKSWKAVSRLHRYDNLHLRITRGKRFQGEPQVVVDSTLADLADLALRIDEPLKLVHYVHGDAQTLSLVASVSR